MTDFFQTYFSTRNLITYKAKQNHQFPPNKMKVRIDIAYYLDTPLQYSCLGNPMDGGAWWAAVHEVAKSQTRLSDFFHFSFSRTGEENGNPLQCSCLENPRDGGAWWAAVYGVTQSRTRLMRLSSSVLLSICYVH